MLNAQPWAQRIAAITTIFKVLNHKRKFTLNVVNDLVLNVIILSGIRCGRVVSVGDFETGCPGFDPQSRHYGHGGVPLGKAQFLA